MLFVSSIIRGASWFFAHVGSFKKCHLELSLALSVMKLIPDAARKWFLWLNKESRDWRDNRDQFIG